MGGGPAFERCLGLEGPVRLVRHPAKGQPHIADDAVTHRQRGGHRHQCKRIRGPITHLAVGRMGGQGQRCNLQRGDQLTGGQVGVLVWRGAGQAVKVGKRQAALTIAPLQHHHPIQRRQRDAQVRRMHGHASLTGAQHRVVAAKTIPCRAAGARRPFVARRRQILKVHTAGALQQVAPGGGHVAQLARRAGQQGLGHERQVLADQRMGGHVAVAHQRADAQQAVIAAADLGQRRVNQAQPADVNDLRGRAQPQPQVIDQVGAAGQKSAVGAQPRDGIGHAGGALVGKRRHRAISALRAAIRSPVGLPGALMPAPPRGWRPRC